MAVGVEANERLQQRCSQLIDQRDHPDLRERQTERLFEHGIDGQQDRLDHVIHQMRHADGAQHLEGGGRVGRRRGGGLRGSGSGDGSVRDAGNGVLGGIHGAHAKGQDHPAPCRDQRTV
ncbi:hypothetical protein G6F57_023237 [Rhizopus arrhizus]|nr:hypothetical protein G6F57_023237 [Rhizopus arrhizus]